MNKLFTLSLILIFNLNTYAFARGSEIQTIEQQKSEFIIKIDKLIAKEKKNPTSMKMLEIKLPESLKNLKEKD